MGGGGGVSGATNSKLPPLPLQAWLCDGSDEDSQLCQNRTQHTGGTERTQQLADTGREEKADGTQLSGDKGRTQKSQMSDGTQEPRDPMEELANQTHCEEHEHPCDDGR